MESNKVLVGIWKTEYETCNCNKVVSSNVSFRVYTTIEKVTSRSTNNTVWIEVEIRLQVKVRIISSVKSKSTDTRELLELET